MNFLGFIVNLATGNFGEAFLRVIVALTIQIPRITVEIIFAVKDYNDEWAKICYLTRLITTIIGIFINITVIILIAVFGNDTERAIGISVLTVYMFIWVGFDAYFTLMYFYYWKQIEERYQRHRRRENRYPARHANNQDENIPPTKAKSNTPPATNLPAKQPEVNEKNLPPPVPTKAPQTDLETGVRSQEEQRKEF